MILYRFISKTDETNASKENKNEFVNKLKCYIEVRSLMQKAYIFAFEEWK